MTVIVAYQLKKKNEKKNGKTNVKKLEDIMIPIYLSVVF